MVFEVGEAVEVTTEDVAQGGWCVARPPGLPVLFVRHALPGERVVARVTEVTSRFARADAVEIREPSPDRVAAPCPYAHSGGCGGCIPSEFALHNVEERATIHVLALQAAGENISRH